MLNNMSYVICGVYSWSGVGYRANYLGVRTSVCTAYEVSTRITLMQAIFMDYI